MLFRKHRHHKFNNLHCQTSQHHVPSLFHNASLLFKPAHHNDHFPLHLVQPLSILAPSQPLTTTPLQSIRLRRLTTARSHSNLMAKIKRSLRVGLRLSSTTSESISDLSPQMKEKSTLSSVS